MTSRPSADAFPDTPDAWLATLGDAQPLHTTLPTPGAEHDLAAVEKVAAILKTPLLPWQRFVARVLTEKDADGSYRYPVALVTVPRQSGKTTLLRAILTARALKHPHRRAFMTAQTGQDARARLFDLTDRLEHSPIGKTLKVRRAADSPRVEFHNKSRLGAFSPTPESLHGYTIHDCLLDEIFAFDDIQGNNLLGAITPAQSTIRDRQLLMCSTMGTVQSTFLNRWIEQGRQATSSPDAVIAYFEWSLPEGADPFDAEGWDFHPGLQGGLITKADIAAAAETMSKGEFIRAYMNKLTVTAESLFDMRGWAECKGQLSTPKRSDVAIGWEVAQDRSRAAVVAAWRAEDRKIHLKVLRTDAGTSWLPDLLTDLAASRPLMLGADRYAQNLVIADGVFYAKPDIEMALLKPEQLKTASASLKAHIEDRTLVHDGHLSLTSAMSTAVSRPMGEGWALSHRTDPEAMAALVAVRLVEEVKAKAKAWVMVGD